MPKQTHQSQQHRKAKTRRAIAVAAILVALCAITVLAINVTREIRLLGSAKSDNVQWSLAQTQVEFLEFKNELYAAKIALGNLRQDFDIFYSRVATLRQASVFEGLRANEISQGYIRDITAFVDDAVTIIDAPDPELRARIPALAQSAQDIAPMVRLLANSALEVFAKDADAQRATVARTLTQLAAALVALVAALGIGILYLNRLNRRIYRRERAHQQTAMRMKTVINTSLDGVIMCNADGAIIAFSPAAEKIFGHAEQDVLGRNVGDVIVPPDLRCTHKDAMDRLMFTRDEPLVGKGRVTLTAVRNTGARFPLEVALQTATTHQGDVFIAFLRDISRRVAARTELIRARDRALAGEKLKTDFLATMSHEIRTPLNGLLGNMNLLRDTALTPDQDRYLGYMDTSGRLLMNHISDVLDITRYDAGKVNTRSQPVNITALLQDIVDSQNSMAAKNDTILNWRWLGVCVDWIMSDQDRLQHVMMNLVGNAVKFTKAGRIDITIENIGTAEQPELDIQISDTGIGIAPELQATIFNDFVTGNTAYDRDVGGTGLGLSIAKRFITAMGGDIGVNSIPDKGSTFWVRLPVTTARPVCAKPADVPPRPADGPLKVLLVEDNQINRIVAREMLQSDGHTVTEAHDGKQGADIAQTDRFDLILMDISMPVMDGRTATRLIRSQSGASAAAKIIALTANINAQERIKFVQDGMNGIITKPLSRDALRTVLRDARADLDNTATHERPDPATAAQNNVWHKTQHWS